MTMVMTNSEFASKDKNFIDACSNAGVAATKRQASKWRMSKGLAYQKRNTKKGE